jgi:hypothetical protein
MNQDKNETAHLSTLGLWCSKIGVSRVTACRWRREGLLTTINVRGRAFVTRQESERFAARAAMGEFSKSQKSNLPAARLQPRAATPQLVTA